MKTKNRLMMFLVLFIGMIISGVTVYYSATVTLNDRNSASMVLGWIGIMITNLIWNQGMATTWSFPNKRAWNMRYQVTIFLGIFFSLLFLWYNVDTVSHGTPTRTILPFILVGLLITLFFLHTKPLVFKKFEEE